MGPTWGPFGADRTQLGPIVAPWTLLSGIAFEDAHMGSSHKSHIVNLHILFLMLKGHLYAWLPDQWTYFKTDSFHITEQVLSEHLYRVASIVTPDTFWVNTQAISGQSIFQKTSDAFVYWPALGWLVIPYAYVPSFPLYCFLIGLLLILSKLTWPPFWDTTLTLWPRQTGRHDADDVIKSVCLKQKLLHFDSKLPEVRSLVSSGHWVP